MKKILFVYGSLSHLHLSGMASYLHKFVYKKEEAKVRGKLIYKDGYPALINEGKGVVKGFLLHFRNSPQLMKKLDFYEGAGYKRATLLIECKTHKIKGEAYVLKGQVFDTHVN